MWSVSEFVITYYFKYLLVYPTSVFIVITYYTYNIIYFYKMNVPMSWMVMIYVLKYLRCLIYDQYCILLTYYAI